VPSKLAHVVIQSGFFRETRDWYMKVLCADVAFENDDVVFLRYDDEHHRLGIINAREASPLDKRASGVEHISFTFPMLEQLLSTYLRLKGLGILPFWPIIHGPTVSLYYRDPNGVKVEMQYDVFKTPAEVDAFFAAGSYVENFMGVIFDPEEMIKRYESGESLSSLTKRPPLPPGTGPWDMHRE
jgi:catechol-2,3-dioxygenase